MTKNVVIKIKKNDKFMFFFWFGTFSLFVLVYPFREEGEGELGRRGGGGRRGRGGGEGKEERGEEGRGMRRRNFIEDERRRGSWHCGFRKSRPSFQL